MAADSSVHPPSIGVVGAGLAGATAASRLADLGTPVLALDKGRGPGGRAARRRVERLHYDHGAQYFTARDPAFRSTVDRWIERGAAARWDGRLVAIGADRRPQPMSDEPRYVGAPGMNEIVRDTLERVDTRFGERVVRLDHSPRGWTIRTESELIIGPFQELVLAVPAPQAADLLADAAPLLAARAAAVTMAPTWAAMITWKPGDAAAAFDGATLTDHPCLAWVARNGSKAGRPDHDSWVVHASGEWSARNIEMERDAVRDHLSSALAELLGRSATDIATASAHRWRYAFVENPIGEAFLRDASIGLTVCGDWLLGPRIECAFLSGLAAAEALVNKEAPA